MLNIFYVIFAIFVCGGAHSYEIPGVHIEVYYPRGLRVIISHVDGMRLFAFHGNINRPMRDYEIGQYYKDVLRPINGTWIYEDGAVRLRKGDKLYYWLYVLHDRLGYRKDNQVFLIDELINDEMPTSDDGLEDRIAFNDEPLASVLQAKKYKSLSYATPPPLIHTTTRPSATTTTAAPNMERESLQSCNSLLANVTLRLVRAQDEVDALVKSNDILYSVLEQKEEYRKLTLRGRLLHRGTPQEIVELILSEKLGLRPKLLNATRNKDNSITFELTDVRHAVEVIRVAEEKLANSSAVSITF